MLRLLLALGCAGTSALALASFSAAPPSGIDLTGHWTLNLQLSDDAEHLLAERLEEERKRYARWRRDEERARPPGVPADDAENVAQPPVPARGPRPWQKRRDENYRKMLGMTAALTIQQSGSVLQLESALDSRRLQAGSRTQVSMPEGQLADSNVGWDGEWFVIERKVRQGPRLLEKLRLLKKTGQLEYRLAVSGDTELAGIKVRRIFDRGHAAPPPPPNPALGPVR